MFIARVYERVFRPTGHQIEIVKNGIEAVEHLDKMPEAPDVIALDMVMPLMNGLEVLRNIRSSEKLKDTPVVIISNSVNDKDKEELSKLGVSLYLTKIDQTPEVIVKKLEGVIKNKQ